MKKLMPFLLVPVAGSFIVWMLNYSPSGAEDPYSGVLGIGIMVMVVIAGFALYTSTRERVGESDLPADTQAKIMSIVMVPAIIAVTVIAFLLGLAYFLLS